MVPPGVLSTIRRSRSGVRDSEFERYPAAERLAGQVRPLQTEVIEQGSEVVDVGIEFEVAIGRSRVALPGKVVGDDGEVLGKCRYVA